MTDSELRELLESADDRVRPLRLRLIRLLLLVPHTLFGEFFNGLRDSTRFSVRPVDSVFSTPPGLVTFLGLAKRILAHQRLVKAAPGARFLSILEWWYSAKVVASVLRPALHDMQFEYFETLAEGRTRKAQWVLLRGYVSIISAAVAQLPLSAVKVLVKLWKAAS